MERRETKGTKGGRKGVRKENKNTTNIIVWYITNLNTKCQHHIGKVVVIYRFCRGARHDNSFSDLGEGDEVALAIHDSETLGIAVQSPACCRALHRDHFVRQAFWHLLPRNERQMHCTQH